MIDRAFSDSQYLKKRYGKVFKVAIFFQGLTFFALIFFLVIFLCRVYWIHNFDKALELNDVYEATVLNIKINHGFNNFESLIYIFAALGEVQVSSNNTQHLNVTTEEINKLYMPAGAIEKMGIMVGKTIPVLSLPQSSTVFPVNYYKTTSESLRSEIVFFLIMSLFLAACFWFFRSKKNSITQYIYTKEFTKSSGICTLKSEANRTIYFKYKLFGKDIKGCDIVTEEEFDQIQLNDKLLIIIPSTNKTRAYIKPITPVINW